MPKRLIRSQLVYRFNELSNRARDRAIEKESQDEFNQMEASEMALYDAYVLADEIGFRGYGPSCHHVLDSNKRHDGDLYIWYEMYNQGAGACLCCKSFDTHHLLATQGREEGLFASTLLGDIAKLDALPGANVSLYVSSTHRGPHYHCNSISINTELELDFDDDLDAVSRLVFNQTIHRILTGDRSGQVPVDLPDFVHLWSEDSPCPVEYRGDPEETWLRYRVGVLVSDFIDATVRDACRDVYKRIEETYESGMSDENLAAWLEDRDDWYDVRGERVDILDEEELEDCYPPTGEVVFDV